MALESSNFVLYMGKISFKSGNWFGNCWAGGKILHITHKHKNKHISMPILCLFFFCEKSETRLKRYNESPSFIFSVIFPNKVI